MGGMRRDEAIQCFCFGNMFFANLIHDAIHTFSTFHSGIVQTIKAIGVGFLAKHTIMDAQIDRGIYAGFGRIHPKRRISKLYLSREKENIIFPLTTPHTADIYTSIKILMINPNAS